MNRKDIQLLAEGYKRVMQEDDATMAGMVPAQAQQTPIPAGMLQAAKPSLAQRLKLRFAALRSVPDNQLQDIVAMIQQGANSPDFPGAPQTESVVGRISFGSPGKTYGPSNLPPGSGEITIKITPEEKEQIVNGLIALTDDYSGRGEAREEYLNTINALIDKLDPATKKEVSRPERHRRFQDVHGDISGHVDHE